MAGGHVKRSAATPGGKKPEPTDLIQSVRRALRVMETIGSTPSGMYAKQIARACELTLPTTYHLVRTLTYEGYLTKTDDGRFQVGLKVSDRYADLAAAMRGPATVSEVLRRTAGDTGYSHYLGRMIDGRVAITAVTEGTRSPHVEDLILGFDEGAHATALGKALLSTMTGPERKRNLAQTGMRRYTSSTVIEPRELEYDLARLATRGVYTEVGQFREGVGCAASVVRDDPDQRYRTVIACTMPLAELRIFGARVKNRLERAAEELQPLL
ncbi:IclR family transcriptional regulator [Stackebrandtia soli]|uniref:IclR family transcriptional regulator n=1 Tax=Stackebrandtia soli TaxID=1892856 RepID=UPI0039E7B047